MGADEEVNKKDGKTTVTRSSNNVFAKAERTISLIGGGVTSDTKPKEKGKPLSEMDDNAKVGEFLSYSKNEIKIVCRFKTLHEIFQEQVAAKAKEFEEKFNTEKETKLSLMTNITDM